jgi:CRP-like cAMP-binding protein
VDRRRIRAFRIFADLPPGEIEELVTALHEAQFRAGTNVMTVEDYGTAAYFIEDGRADVLSDDGATTATLGRGDVFGEIGLLLTGRRTATVVARTPLRLLSLSGSDFDRIRARVPELERVLRSLGRDRVER